MTDLTIVPKWNAAINRLERNEFATGGADGNMNIAPRQLAENIFWLKDDIDSKLTTLTEYNITQAAAISAKANTVDVDNKNTLQDAVINSKASKTEVDTKNSLQDTAINKNATDIQAIIASPVGSASTTKAGIVQLSTATNSTSTTLAATASAVKAAWDKGNAAIPNSEKGANNGIASLGADGKVPSSQLPVGGLSTDASGNLAVSSIQAGVGAPKLKYFLVSGTMPNYDSNVTAALPFTKDKVVGLTGVVEGTYGLQPPNMHPNILSNNLWAMAILNDNRLWIATGNSGLSGFVINKPFRVLITYTD